MSLRNARSLNRYAYYIEMFFTLSLTSSVGMGLLVFTNDYLMKWLFSNKLMTFLGLGLEDPPSFSFFSYIEFTSVMNYWIFLLVCVGLAWLLRTAVHHYSYRIIEVKKGSYYAVVNEAFTWFHVVSIFTICVVFGIIAAGSTSLTVAIVFMILLTLKSALLYSEFFLQIDLVV